MLLLKFVLIPSLHPKQSKRIKSTIPEKLVGQSKEIKKKKKKKKKKRENEKISFIIIFSCYDQSLPSGRKTAH